MPLVFYLAAATTLQSSNYNSNLKNIYTMTIQEWKADASKIFYSVLASYVLSFFNGIIAAVAILHTLSGGTPWYAIVFPLLVVAAFVFYFLGVSGMAKKLTGVDQQSFMKIRTAIILNIVATLCSLIPVAGSIIALILNIIAFIFLLQAYSALKASPTFPVKARSGASLLFIATILNLIGVILAIIPLIGIIGSLLNLVADILIIIGWYKVMSANPAEV